MDIACSHFGTNAPEEHVSSPCPKVRTWTLPSLPVMVPVARAPRRHTYRFPGKLVLWSLFRLCTLFLGSRSCKIDTCKET